MEQHELDKALGHSLKSNYLLFIIYYSQSKNNKIEALSYYLIY